MTTIFTYLALTVKLAGIGFVATTNLHAAPVTQPEPKPVHSPVLVTAEYVEELTGNKISPNATIITVDGVAYRISH